MGKHDDDNSAKLRVLDGGGGEFDPSDPGMWPAVLDVDDVACILRLTPQHVRALAKVRKIPGAFRFGRFWRFKAERFKRWLRED